MGVVNMKRYQNPYTTNVELVVNNMEVYKEFLKGTKEYLEELLNEYEGIVTKKSIKIKENIERLAEGIKAYC
jgi:hypothetical protein